MAQRQGSAFADLLAMEVAIAIKEFAQYARPQGVSLQI